MIAQKQKRVGLALGGGVARGPAHIGVLAVLEEEGIQIDFVSGTSAGSIVGALFAAGLPMERIYDLISTISWSRFTSLVWPKEGFVSLDKLETWLIGVIGDVKFEDLNKPYCVIATDMQLGSPVRFIQGRLAPAVHASCSVPGFIKPVCIDGRILGDGSLVDNVIGVDLFSSAIRSGWGPFGFGFTAVEILVERAGGGTWNADCTIIPKLAGVSYLSFRNKKKLIALGRQAALEKVSEIKRDLE
jgi:NTE family protein